MFDPTDPNAPPGCGPLLPAVGLEVKPLKQQAFEHVRARGQAARAEISRALEISPASVTALTSDLIAQGLLREVEGPPREGRDTPRGRPPVALEILPGRHHVVGIKLSDDRHTAVLADFAGTILAEETMEVRPALKSAQELCDEAAALLSALLAQAPPGATDIARIGIGLSGIVDSQSGIVPWSPLLAGEEIDLRRAAASRLGFPVEIENDANLLTLAELWFGAGRGIADFAVVTIERGVGMGLVIGNRLYRGSRGMGLELGHTKVQLDGALCRCGSRGCLEAYLSDYALAREAATALGRAPSDQHSPRALLEQLFNEARNGNHAARTIFRRAGQYLSLGLANVIQLFDPALIILSGERMRYDYLFAEEVLAEMQALTLGRGRDPCRVEIHAWGDMVWARGAAALALSALTDDILGT